MSFLDEASALTGLEALANAVLMPESTNDNGKVIVSVRLLFLDIRFGILLLMVCIMFILISFFYIVKVYVWAILHLFLSFI